MKTPTGLASCRILNQRQLRGARVIASAPFCVCGLLFGDQFDATVLCASFGSIVGRHEVGLAVTMRM